MFSRDHCERLYSLTIRQILRGSGKRSTHPNSLIAEGVGNYTPIGCQVVLNSMKSLMS